MRQTIIPSAIMALSLAACGSPDTDVENDMAMDDTASQAAASQATADLMTADGTPVGTVTVTGDEASGLTVMIEAMDMPPGMHGVHIHTTGACAPDFTAAGGHWNPEDSMHGLEGDPGQHAGDMPNLEIGEDGAGTLTYTLAGGATMDGLLDADGSAFVVHAGEDDQTTDPSGDSGDRIACGVFEAG